MAHSEWESLILEEVVENMQPVTQSIPQGNRTEGAGKVLAYAAYHKAFSNLKEEFHRTGRYDDSNAKLDEIVKLLVMCLHEARRAKAGNIDRFSNGFLSRYAHEHFDDGGQIARALRTLSEEILTDSLYQNPDGTSIFGNHPSLDIQPTDNEFAKYIVEAIKELSPHLTFPNVTVEEFDVLNESFGHFVRDTFRQTKEDGQYMTPPEVVSAMVDMVFSDIENSEEELQRILSVTEKNPYIVLDPTCGVGSFLIQALRRMFRIASTRCSREEFGQLAKRLCDYSIYGQDKVDRMERLAKLNLFLFGGSGNCIWQGNSIRGTSPLDSVEGRVDLILTNPPFGAEYDVEELLHHSPPERYPMLRQLHTARRLPRRLNSELILLDRYLSLLKPGGRALVVLPDSVISAKGVEATVRSWLGERAQLRAVVELPSVTFAQAGTRTKACFAYLVKNAGEGISPNVRSTYMTICEDLGFEVSERSGTPTKIPKGENQLLDISRIYRETSTSMKQKEAPYFIVNEHPSAVWVRNDALIKGRWTAGFYHVRRLRALTELERLKEKGFQLYHLKLC